MRATRKLAIFLKPFWQWAVPAPLLMVLEVTMDLLQPRRIERIIHQGIARSDLPLVIDTGLLMVGAAPRGSIAIDGLDLRRIKKDD